MEIHHLHTQVRGEGDALLLIHGIISDSGFFDAAAERLSEHYRVITYDRRGYGKSRSGNWSSYTVKEQAEDAEAILRALCTSPAWIVGNSAGGLIATQLALQAPELVCGMILLEPSFGYDAQANEDLRAWNRELNEYVAQKRIKRALPAFTRVIGGAGADSAPVSMAELKSTYQNLESFLYGELNEVQSYLPPLEQLQALTVPAAIGVTTEGKDSIFARSSHSAARLIGWPVEHFPGRHNVGKDQPKEFAARVSEIIQKWSGL